jgi:hypothetical protein
VDCLRTGVPGAHTTANRDIGEPPGATGGIRTTTFGTPDGASQAPMIEIFRHRVTSFSREEAEDISGTSE